MRRWDYIILLATLGVGLTLRCIKLDNVLWFDEIVTLVEFVRLPTFQLMGDLSSLNNHIFYSLQAQAAIAVFGESAWSLRLPAVLFGVACIAAIWWLARDLVGVAEAHLTAVLLAVSYHHIWFSQNARGYTGIMFWAIVGTILFLRGIERPTWAIWAAYAFAFAAGVYTHLSAGFFFATHGLIYLFLVGVAFLIPRAGAKAADARAGLSTKPLFGFALAGLLVLLLHAPVLPQLFQAMQTVSTPTAQGVAAPQWRNPIWTALEVVRNLRNLGILASFGLPAVLALATVGVVSLGRRRPVLAALFVAHIPFTLLCVWLLSFRIWPRYFFIDLGFIFLLVIHGTFVVCSVLWKAVPLFKGWGLSGEKLGLLASSAAILCSLFLLPANYRIPKQDFVGARDYVERERGPDDVIGSVGLASYAYSNYYAPQWLVLTSWEDIQESRRPASHTWIVYTSVAHMTQNHADVLQHVPSEFDLVQEFPGTLGDGTVFVYRTRETSSR